MRGLDIYYPSRSNAIACQHRGLTFSPDTGWWVFLTGGLRAQMFDASALAPQPVAPLTPGIQLYLLIMRQWSGVTAHLRKHRRLQQPPSPLGRRQLPRDDSETRLLLAAAERRDESGSSRTSARPSKRLPASQGLGRGKYCIGSLQSCAVHEVFGSVRIKLD